MTTVEFGGGPTLAARKRFANLKDGSQIPKYTGHIHQIRFRQGHTYGEQTHILSQEPTSPLKPTQPEEVQYDLSNPYETREFPDGLIPGYAGYVPQRKYQHSNRYRVETDACLSQTKNAYEQGRQNVRELKSAIAGYPKTQSTNSDTTVKHFLDYHRAYHPLQNAQKDDRRPFVEPPIPGYTGYIPRIIPIGAGLGLRYHEATNKALNRFAFETTHSMTNLPTSIDNQPPPSINTNPENLMKSRPATGGPSYRIYSNIGMVPKYTGYLPQRKYRVGQTFGDTTRELPVCSHSYSNYGELLRSKTFI
ncbi:unnamed protein product [Adineta steineri]|uniref:Uncharacterized protein n=1 Tax=Adineta steineri TaxID=433720 RepID=A0A818TCM4_9BILA|nr:unnamed protein product [Adineta steineri]CAF0979667.1 unnamed protein product [Adineta steineri]CAF1076637.1 unnamed protein product [Adineta steineri]CAF1366823.1 unnamed protein product [Adineta steineri]CAF1438413.1 unnamed protein product [Adineta steineri]